jgi:hypothetical protein
LVSPETCSPDFVQTTGTLGGFAARGTSSAIADAGIEKTMSARTILILPLVLKREKNASSNKSFRVRRALCLPSETSIHQQVFNDSRNHLALDPSRLEWLRAP